MSAIVTWTRRHRLVAFFGLTFLLSWWSWPFYAVDLAPTAFFPCGPLVAALVVIGITEGRAGYRDLGARMIRWRVGWTWWLVAVGTPLAVLAVAAAANVAIWGAPAPVLATMAWSQLALGAAVRFVNPLDGPLGEEPGWRGYALPQLQARRSPLAAGLVLAVFVALWHLPLVATGQLATVALPITFAITLVYVWLFNRTGGSVLMTMVFHVAQGRVSYGALGFAGADAARMDWLTGALWFALALAVIVLDRRRVAGRPRRLERRSGQVAAGRTLTGRSAPLGPSGPAARGLQSAARRTGRPGRRATATIGGRRWRATRSSAPRRQRLRAGRPRSPRDPPARRLGRCSGPPQRWPSWPCSRPSCSADVPVDPVDVVLRLVGGSFAACGLVAWRRRPDSRSGLLMTATGFAFLAAGAAARDLDSPLAADGRALALRPVDAVLRPAGADLPHGRPAAHRRRTGVLVGAVVVEIVVLAPLWLVFADDPATLLLLLPGPGVADVVDTVQRALYLAIPVGTAAVVGARWRAVLDAGPAGDAAERRGCGLPAAVGGAARSSTSSSAARATSSCCGSRPARSSLVPVAFLVGPAAVAAGARRAGRPVRRAAHDAARRAAGGAGAGAGRPGVRDRLRRPRRRFVDVDGRPVDAARADVRPVGDRGWQRDGEPVAALSTTGRSTTTPSWSRPSAGRRRSRWRTGCCTPSPTPGSPSCRPPASASSPPPTPSGAASSATCTTAPSSGWSRWPCSSR